MEKFASERRDVVTGGGETRPRYGGTRPLSTAGRCARATSALRSADDARRACRSSRSDSGGVSLDDATLVARVLAGDSSAYAGLVERYQDDVFRLAMRFVRRREDAEDLSQEAFVRAYRALAQYDPARPFGAWMYAITSRLCIDFHRRRRLPTVSLTRPEEGSASGEREWDLPSEEEGPDVTLEHSEEAERLGTLIDRLPPDYRMAILLRHAHDLSYEEIAQATNAPIGTVKARIHRARMQLRVWIEGREEPAEAPGEPEGPRPSKKGGPTLHPGGEIPRKGG